MGVARFRSSSRRRPGARFRCVDGHEYTDFCLGDTGAMAGHGPSPTIAAVERQMRRGITHMLPTEDAIWAGEELGRRFGLPFWQFTITATDANRFSIRLARQATGRSKVVVHDHCYHGSVDETFATLDADGRVVAIGRLGRAAGADRRKRRGSCRSTTSPHSSARSPIATSRPYSSSRP